MAFKADGEVRDSGKSLGFEEPVAGIAVEALLGVLLMIKGDRLPGSGAETKTDNDEDQKKTGRQTKEKKFHPVDLLVNRAYPEYRRAPVE
jgi:hypothetical protein